MANPVTVLPSSATAKELLAFMRERIVLFDGAMGTSIQARQPQADDFGGPQYDGCNEYLVVTRPHIVTEIHAGFLKAGVDIIETDTFGGTRIVLAEFGLQDKTLEINQAAARLARDVAQRYSTATKPRFVCGSMGPTTKTISVTGGVTFDQMRAAYAEQAEGLLLGGVDLLILETAQDTLNVKAGVIGIHETFRKLGIGVPLIISGTIETMGTTLAGKALKPSTSHWRITIYSLSG